MQKEAKLEDIFDESLKNMVSLEKIIYESIPMYKENPTEHMKYIITNLCNNARNQISVLIEMLPKVCNGELLVNYREKLDLKYEDLINIQKEIQETKQK